MAVLIYVIGFIIFVLIPLPIQILLLLVDVSFGGIGPATILMVVGVVLGRMSRE